MLYIFIEGWQAELAYFIFGQYDFCFTQMTLNMYLEQFNIAKMEEDS